MKDRDAWDATGQEGADWVPERLQALGLPPVRRSDAELAGCLWADLVEAYEQLLDHPPDAIRLVDGEVDLESELVDFEINLQHVIWHYEALARFLYLIDLWDGHLLPHWKPRLIPKTWSTRVHRVFRQAKMHLSPTWRNRHRIEE